MITMNYMKLVLKIGLRSPCMIEDTKSLIDLHHPSRFGLIPCRPSSTRFTSTLSVQVDRVTEPILPKLRYEMVLVSYMQRQFQCHAVTKRMTVVAITMH